MNKVSVKNQETNKSTTNVIPRIKIHEYCLPSYEGECYECLNCECELCGISAKYAE